MRVELRDRVGLVAGVLSVVSLALVFAAALEVVPRWLLPHNDFLVAAIPHANAAISVVAIGTILAGVRAIRRGHVLRHRRAMLVALGLFAAFLVLYLYRVALVGPTSFEGVGPLATVYPVLLAVHVILAMVCIPLLYYVLLLGMTRPVAAIRESVHARIGRVAVVLWVTSFALGVTVYGFLHAPL